MEQAAAQSCFDASLCTGIWPRWGLPELCRYTLLKLLTSNMCSFCCWFTFQSPVDSALAKDSAVVQVLGCFLFVNLKSVCKGIALSSTSVSQDAYVHCPTCLQTRLVCGTG